MAASGLLALLDDIAALLDDIALMTRVATKKTAGVIGDDLALNADQVTGMRADRELPVVWAVAKGALLNKVILVPLALLISATVPRAITPLLMIGGLFLCYEGFHKVWEKLTTPKAQAAAERAARLQALADGTVDMVAHEKEKVKGAIRTDFILSAEIVVIALGTMTAAPIGQQVAALAAVGIGVTVLVYGLVAVLVKLDDLGLRLHRGEPSAVRRGLGTVLLRGTPLLMKGLSIAGTAAMFMVGGGIVVHGVPAIDQVVHGAVAAIAADGTLGFTILKTLADALVGVLAGGIISGALGLVQKLRGTPAPQPESA
ncbi:MAG: DUF808 domain-containing protein [Gemmatimonadaceae bacterium]|jgi:hypothetical protein|nr:DUF808 domain-containing protein [Gemmatimonadaceae bacterium]